MATYHVPTLQRIASTGSPILTGPFACLTANNRLMKHAAAVFSFLWEAVLDNQVVVQQARPREVGFVYAEIE